MNNFAESIFRAYDMRGTYPDQLNEAVAYAAGQAFVTVMRAKRVVVGHDVRPSGTPLVEAMVRGITDMGAEAIEIGVISTEMLYFAAATLECDGGMSVTASHNPKEWNGIKFITKGARPITRDGELGQIYDAIKNHEPRVVDNKGTVTQQNLTSSYIQYLHRFIPENLPQLKIVANVNYGANGQYVDAIVDGLPLHIVRMNWEQDGTFPKGTPDPSLEKNREELSRRIVEEGADFGAAWDADADRCFFFDEKGRWFSGYFITALLIKHFLEQDRGGVAIIEHRLTWANLDAAREAGGSTAYSRTGHGYIKKAMRDHNAVFGGEMSGHYYYRDYFFCDSGLITFLSILGIFAAEIAGGLKVSEFMDSYHARYPIPESEMNYITPDAKKIIDAANEHYQNGEKDLSDGLTVEYPDWRFNLRMSDNEPVLRLNLEAHAQDVLTAKQAEITQFIESFGATLRNDHA